MCFSKAVEPLHQLWSIERKRLRPCQLNAIGGLGIINLFFRRCRAASPALKHREEEIEAGQLLALPNEYDRAYDKGNDSGAYAIKAGIYESNAGSRLSGS